METKSPVRALIFQVILGNKTIKTNATMKKHIYYLPALLLAGCVAGGCEDRQEGVAFTPVTSGESIQFSVSTGGATSRTEYGEEDELGWTLNWERGDRIGIYTSASTDYVVKKVNDAVVREPNFAPYEILEVEPDGHKYEGDIWPFVNSDNDNKTEQLVWGDKIEENPTLDFYGAYPAERIVKYPLQDGTDGNSFEMQYWTNQKVTVTEKVDNVYKTEPDMKNAYMIAKQAVKPTGDHILLHFDPIMTTLNITITAGKYEVATGIINPVTVTGVSVIMPKALKDGQFVYQTDYTFKEDDDSFVTPGIHGVLKEETVVDNKESVFVGVEWADEAEEHTGERFVDLFEGESITLMAFLPPVKMLENSGAKIKVHTTGALNFVLEVTPEMIQQSRIEIQLPDISPESENELMVNNWISQLDGDIPLKQLSIPGATCSKHDTDADDAEEVTSLLKMGIRAFNMDALFIQQKNQWGISINKYKLSSAVAMALKSFFDENENEFVIIWLDDESQVTRQEYDTDELLTNYWTEPTENNFTQWKVTDVNNKLLVIKRNYYNSGYLEMHRYMINADDTPYQVNRMDHLCKWWNVNGIGDFKSSGEWGVQFVNDGSLNKSIYESIVSSSAQSGFTGIVMVPNAGETFINGQYTYSDLLIQAIIDCNYKFH